MTAEPPRPQAAFVSPQPERQDGSLAHIVRPGDTIHAIALAYDMPPFAIVRQNNLRDDGRWLRVGQELLIREAGTAAAQAPTETVHVVKAGENINVIAVMYRVHPDDIIQLNSLVNGGRHIWPGQELKIPGN